MEWVHRMRIIVHDTLVTAPFLVPLTEGWATTEITISAAPKLGGREIDDDGIAWIQVPEISLLQETHQVVPDIAVVNSGTGAIAMRVPVRPDEVERTPVRLYETSGTAEILARATIQPFYGIQPSEWTSVDSTTSQVVVIEGAEALRPL